jgi:hypothetical protein
MRICSHVARVVALASTWCFAASVHAADWWVAPDGDDAASGAMGEPFATIVRADEVAMPGDVVHVLAGEYEGTFETTASGTEDARISFVSEQKWGAVLVASGGGWIARGDWVDIAGFEYTGNAAVGLLAMGSHTRYFDNWVHHLSPACDGNGGAGIDAGNYDAEDVDMIGNVVHDVWADDTDGTPCNRVQGLYHSILRGVVANNLAWNISGWGIHTWHAPRELVITNNLVFSCGGGIVVGAGDSPGGVVADGFLVANNIVVHNGYGILESGETGLENRYLHNLVWQNENGDVSLQNGLVDENTIVADPLFVDWQSGGGGDYRLADTSPGIDAGTPEGAPGIDIDGVARPQGAGFDIGPYELPVDAGTTGGDDGTTEAPTDDSGGLDSADPTSAADDGIAPTSDEGVAADTTTTSASSIDDGGDGCGCAVRDDRRVVSLLFLAVAIAGRRRGTSGRARALHSS